MEYNLEGGALPPGSITHPHQKGIRAYAGLSLMVASKWFSNIDSDDYKLFSKFCEGKIGKKIANTTDIAPSIVKSMISVMVNIEDLHFNYNYMGLNHNEEIDFLEDILKRYFDEIYSLGVSTSRKNLIVIIRTVLEAVFIFTVYKQVIEHLIPNHNNSSGYGLGKNLSSSFWKLDYVKENMLDKKRFARDSDYVLENIVGERASLYCWWYLNDEVAKHWYHKPLPSSLWGNPPMGSILFTIKEHEKIPTYFFHMMLNTNTNPGNRKYVGEKLHNHSQTKVDSWSFVTISLNPSVIDRMAQSFVSKTDSMLFSSAKADFLDRLRRLEFLETIAGSLAKHQWFSSDPLWEILKYKDMAGFVKMNDTSNPRMTFINWPYELPFNI